MKKTLRPELVEEQVFEAATRDLYRTTEPDGVFYYTVFKEVTFFHSSLRFILSEAAL